MHLTALRPAALRRSLLSAAVAVLCASGASAAVTASGTVVLSPNPGVLLGPGDVDLPNTTLRLGFMRRQATFSADAGSQVTLAYFNFSGDGLNTSTATLIGPGTRMNLTAVGTTNRFGLGNPGRASMTISDGAVLDGRAQRQRCDSGGACQNSIASAAGSHGTLTVAGAGSEAHFIRMFHLANLSYNAGSGLRGQDALGTVRVLGGALLSTELPIIAAGFTGNPLDGTERAIATVTVSGAGSRWEVLGSPFSGGATQLSAALDRQAIVQMTVSQGGTLNVAASPAGTQTSVSLGTGGQFDGVVSGPGSQWRIEGDGSNGRLTLGANAGNATLQVSDGGHLWSRTAVVQVGTGGGQGALRIAGAASRADLGTAAVSVGDPGAITGSGWLQVTQGSVLEAGHVDIAPTGLLSGSGTVLAPVFNSGTINPGDSPGTLRLAGGLTNLPGGRIVLEVESDGGGGFVTDRLVFAGGAPNLADAQVTFSFLGGTDPAAFQTAGLFDIGNFLRVGNDPIAPALLAGANYAATSSAFVISNFSYTPQGGASFSATPVPEPSTLLLWLVGAAALGGRVMRRRRP